MNKRRQEGSVWIHIVAICALLVTTQGVLPTRNDGSRFFQYNNEGGCQLPASWSGRWFQLGAGKHISINATHIDSKGECVSKDGDEKYVLHDRTDKCYRCIAIHEKHANVLQYKETFCMPENSLDELCNLIIGDALLLSMFRVEATPVVCPFKSPPFSVIYSRGYGDCKQPPSRADSCTDDTRLVLRYQACPDVSGSEASVEELECLATWRDSSINYLVGRLHHKMATTDEEMYRCFVYEKHDQRYLVAQSGEATCSGMTSALEGSRVIRLTRVETQHTRCKFPSWVTQHYHWHSLDFRHNYHFSHRNASLRISSGTNEVETKLVCHTVVSENSHLAKLVVHVVSGCDGGYKCMTILKRDAHVIQMYHSSLSTEPKEACSSTYHDANFAAHPVTLITASLPVSHCPMEGRYGPASGVPLEPLQQECSQHTNLQSLFVGCNPAQDTLEFQSNCRTIPATSYSCHGSWRDNSTSYVIGSPVSRHSTDARYYCFVFRPAGAGLGSTPNAGGGSASSTIVLQRVAETCALSARPVEWSFNITEIGKCSESSFAAGRKLLLLPWLLGVALLMLCCLHSFR